MPEQISIGIDEAEALAMRACRAVKASEATARSLVDATLSAALHGPAMLGFPHFLDYLASFREGRINCHPRPELSRSFAAFLVSDADGGIAQLGFDQAFQPLIETARQFGVAIFTQTNSYTAGELGYFVRRLAAEGILGIAATNAKAFVAAKRGGPAVYSTNPMALGFPLGEGRSPVVIDQASSVTAYVNIVSAAAERRSIPEGWAVDDAGLDTTDPEKALLGALLPFGGYKGGNIALMVELLSAGLSGGPWSLDVPDFRSGNLSPAVGLTVLAIMPGTAHDRLAERARDQIDRLIGHGVYIPGVSSARPADAHVRMPRPVFDAISEIADDHP